MSSTNARSSESDYQTPKFTRGEKCIFVHLVVTFCVILFLILIYFIHLCVVSHSLRDVFKVSLPTKTGKDVAEVPNYPVGSVYLKDVTERLLCDTILLHVRWSVGPAHCAALRTDPDTASLLPFWRIRYAKQDKTFTETKIKRTIPHPHFDRDDFQNNVGLFEHESSIHIRNYIFSNSGMGMNDNSLRQNVNSLALLGWTINSTIVHGGERPVMMRYEVQPVVTANCARFMTPIVDLRTYEYCVVLRRSDDNSYPDHGSALVIGSNIVGFFGWGEKTGKGAPCIILDLQYFKVWLENIIAW